MQQVTQTAKETQHPLAYSLRRDADPPDAAYSRLSEMRYRGLHVLSLRRDAQRGFSTISRSGEMRNVAASRYLAQARPSRLSETMRRSRRKRVAWASSRGREYSGTLA